MKTLPKIKLPTFKTAFAVMPMSNALYISWFVWQLIKLQAMKFNDGFSKEPNEKTIARQEQLANDQNLLGFSLLSTATFWTIFGQESVLNTTTYVIGLYIYHGFNVLIHMKTAFQMT